jgi:uncharacterized protein
LFAVDTNILIYAVWEDAPEHRKALRFVESWREGDEICVTTWNVLYEFLRVSTHAAVFDKPLSLKAALQFLDGLLETPNITILNETKQHYAIVQELSVRYPRVAANLVHDFHTAAILYEHGIRTLYTADTDFLQFDFLRVIDPVHK